MIEELSRPSELPSKREMRLIKRMWSILGIDYVFATVEISDVLILHH